MADGASTDIETGAASPTTAASSSSSAEKKLPVAEKYFRKRDNRAKFLYWALWTDFIVTGLTVIMFIVAMIWFRPTEWKTAGLVTALIAAICYFFHALFLVWYGRFWHEVLGGVWDGPNLCYVLEFESGSNDDKKIRPFIQDLAKKGWTGDHPPLKPRNPLQLAPGSTWTAKFRELDDAMALFNEWLNLPPSLEAPDRGNMIKNLRWAFTESGSEDYSEQVQTNEYFAIGGTLIVAACAALTIASITIEWQQCDGGHFCFKPLSAVVVCCAIVSVFCDVVALIAVGGPFSGLCADKCLASASWLFPVSSQLVINKTASELQLAITMCHRGRVIDNNRQFKAIKELVQSSQFKAYAVLNKQEYRVENAEGVGDTRQYFTVRDSKKTSSSAKLVRVAVDNPNPPASGDDSQETKSDGQRLEHGGTDATYDLGRTENEGHELEISLFPSMNAVLVGGTKASTKIEANFLKILKEMAVIVVPPGLARQPDPDHDSNAGTLSAESQPLT